MNYGAKLSAANMIFLLFAGAVALFPAFAVASDMIETSGTVLQVVLPATAYGATLYLDDKEGQMQFYKSFFTNMAVTEALKYTINDERPNNSGDQAFPSGHTSAAFQGAAFIHKRYGFEYSIPAYVCAAFVGYSRIEADKHYPDEVFAGAVIGIVSSFYFAEPYKGVTVAPAASRDYLGIMLTARF